MHSANVQFRSQVRKPAEFCGVSGGKNCLRPIREKMLEVEQELRGLRIVLPGREQQGAHRAGLRERFLQPTMQREFAGAGVVFSRWHGRHYTEQAAVWQHATFGGTSAAEWREAAASVAPSHSLKSAPASFALSVLIEVIAIDLFHEVSVLLGNANAVLDHEFSKSAAIDEDHLLVQSGRILPRIVMK